MPDPYPKPYDKPSNTTEEKVIVHHYCGHDEIHLVDIFPSNQERDIGRLEGELCQNCLIAPTQAYLDGLEAIHLTVDETNKQWGVLARLCQGMTPYEVNMIRAIAMPVIHLIAGATSLTLGEESAAHNILKRKAKRI